MIQWGHKPTKVFEVDVPSKRKQDLIEIGRLRQLIIRLDNGDEVEIQTVKPYPWLVVGQKDNRLYIAGGSVREFGQAIREHFGTGNVGKIIQTDYESKKGEKKSFYYFHEHHSPFATLRIDASGHPHYIGGGYEMRPEGIVD